MNFESITEPLLQPGGQVPTRTQRPLAILMPGSLYGIIPVRR
ncbi:MAG: hypothetical protein ABSG59_13680 [Verrucomicrobiota bacterium]